LKAETAYNVIEALPKEELGRLYALLEAKKKAENKATVKKRTKTISLEQAIELLLVEATK